MPSGGLRSTLSLPTSPQLVLRTVPPDSTCTCIYACVCVYIEGERVTLCVHVASTTHTYKRFIHCFSNFLIAIPIDLLKEFVQSCVSFRFLVLFFVLDLGHNLVPVACVVRGAWVLVYWINTLAMRILCPSSRL